MISSTQREEQEAYGAQELVVDLNKNKHVAWFVEGIYSPYYNSRSIRSRGWERAREHCKEYPKNTAMAEIWVVT